MKLRSIPVLLVALSLAAALLIDSTAQSSRELHVKMTYSGTEEVDSAKGIHVYLFDTPNISEGAMPIGMQSAFRNGEVLKFAGLTPSTVYLVAAYGDYDPMMGPPPSGTPVALYRPGDPGVPTPVSMEPGTVEIEFDFDDAFLMP